MLNSEEVCKAVCTESHITTPNLLVFCVPFLGTVNSYYVMNIFIFMCNEYCITLRNWDQLYQVLEIHLKFSAEKKEFEFLLIAFFIMNSSILLYLQCVIEKLRVLVITIDTNSMYLYCEDELRSHWF